MWARGPTVASAVARRALDVLGADDDPELRAIAHADLARALGELVTIGSVEQGNPLAVDHATQAYSLADELDRQDLRGYAPMFRGCERLAIGDESGSADIDPAVSLLQAFPRADLAVRACVNASGAAFRVGRFADAERYIELGFDLGRDAEFFSGEYLLALTRASVRASMGRWPETAVEFEALLALNGEPGVMAPLAAASWPGSSPGKDGSTKPMRSSSHRGRPVCAATGARPPASGRFEANRTSRPSSWSPETTRPPWPRGAICRAPSAPPGP